MSPRVMTDLSALIVALEGATGPSRELADEVLLACGWTRLAIGCHSSRGLIYNWFNPAREHVLERPDPLSSIDAALTLGRSSAEKFRMLEAVFRADYPADEARHLFIACKAIVLDALKARQASSTPSDQSPVPQQHRTRKE